MFTSLISNIILTSLTYKILRLRAVRYFNVILLRLKQAFSLIIIFFSLSEEYYPKISELKLLTFFHFHFSKFI